MKNHDFRKIGDWVVTPDGKLDLDFPSELKDTPGVIAIAIGNEPVFFSATTHYGPRIKDFKHATNGETTSARIHRLIEASLGEGRTVCVWVKDSQDPHPEKRALIAAFNSIWNSP